VKLKSLTKMIGPKPRRSGRCFDPKDGALDPSPSLE